MGLLRFNKNDVVQFNEKHQWCGSLGIVDGYKECGDDIRYMIGVPIPQKGVAYIFSMESKDEFEYIGGAVLGIASSEVEDDEESD